MWFKYTFVPLVLNAHIDMICDGFQHKMTTALSKKPILFCVLNIEGAVYWFFLKGHLLFLLRILNNCK